MDCLNIGLIGYGVVGQGVVKALKSRRKFLREKYETDFFIKTICDRSISKKPNPGLGQYGVDDVIISHPQGPRYPCGGGVDRRFVAGQRDRPGRFKGQEARGDSQ